MQIYLVGGAVRDHLLGRQVSEFDWVVVGATPEMLLARGFKQVGRDFPVFLHPDTGDEYALARTERKTGKGYTGFACQAAPDITLEQDLLRRDLTINAIAQDDKGQLIDPFNGVRDLELRLLRHVSTAFREDPLRLLRVARFAARYASLGFTIAPETLQLMKDMVNAKEIEHLTAERVWKETEKALSTDSPHIYFQVLYQCGALSILFPALLPLFKKSASQSNVHALMALFAASQLTPNISVRFASLYVNAYRGDDPLAKQHIIAMSAALRLPVEVRDLIIQAVYTQNTLVNALTLTADKIIDLFNHIDVWRKPQLLPQLLLISRANACDENGHPPRQWPQSDYLAQAFTIASTIKAHHVMRDGLTGIAIKNAINQGRIAAVTHWQTENSFNAL